MVDFEAELQSTGTTTAGFEVPDDIVDGLGGGGRPKVAVTVDGYTFRTSIARMGGRYLLGVSSDRRRESGMAAGNTYALSVELDTAPREVEVPPELAAALAADADAKAFFDGLSFSKQSWFTTSVASAKTDDTRARRLDKAMTMLRERRGP